MLPVKVEAGILCADEPLNVTVAEALLASIFPDVRLILPFNVRVFAPTVKVPEVKVNVFGNVRFRLRETPLLLFIINEVFEPIVNVPLPLMVCDEEPFNVNVFADEGEKPSV